MIADSYLEYYRFIGQMVGKAIYEVRACVLVIFLFVEYSKL